MKDKFSSKNTEDSLEKELEYCKQLILVIRENEELCSYPKMQGELNLLEGSVSDDMEHLETSKDGDVKVGHRTADIFFFGYKTHIAMIEEWIITAAIVTSGEKTDGKRLPAPIQRSWEAGMETEAVIGDKAYSSKEDIDAAKDGDYGPVSRLNGTATQGGRTRPDGFEFNKDARSHGHTFWNPDNTRS